jgi:YbbR domain-containing protein
MFRWLWNNLSSLLLAFILALSFWVAAVSAEDPIEVRTMATPISIELRNVPDGLIMVEPPATSTRISLRAPQSVWNDLSATDIEVWADLSSVGSGEHRLALNWRLDARPIEVTRLEPANITFRLEEAASKQMPVLLSVVGEPAIGYQANAPKVDPEQTQVIGPSSAVDRVEQIQAEIDISGSSQQINESVTLVPVDSQAEAVEGVELDPASAQVSISIEDLGGYRSVVVSPQIEGEVEPGYQLTRITVSPTLVRVFSSDPQTISELSGFVETEPVSLDEATSDFERRVSLTLPDGVSIVGEQSVLVRVSISPIENSITISQQVEFQGLEQGLFASVSPEQVSLILNGPLPTLEALTVEDIRVVVDLLGLEIGTHQITPAVIVSSPEVRVQSILPDTIEVTISDTPPATPTPPPES